MHCKNETMHVCMYACMHVCMFLPHRAQRMCVCILQHTHSQKQTYARMYAPACFPSLRAHRMAPGHLALHACVNEHICMLAPAVHGTSTLACGAIDKACMCVCFSRLLAPHACCINTFPQTCWPDMRFWAHVNQSAYARAQYTNSILLGMPGFCRRQLPLTSVVELFKLLREPLEHGAVHAV